MVPEERIVTRYQVLGAYGLGHQGSLQCRAQGDERDLSGKRNIRYLFANLLSADFVRSASC